MCYTPEQLQEIRGWMAEAEQTAKELQPMRVLAADQPDGMGEEFGDPIPGCTCGCNNR
jgi:hypothetical protein